MSWLRLFPYFASRQRLHADLKIRALNRAGDYACELVPKKDRDTFEAEMDAAGAKWQMLVFGGLLHSFSEAESNVPGIGKFDPGAARQCYNMVDDFVTAAFDRKL